jgi:hypothetical protein
LACASLAKPSELSVAPLYSAASSSEPFATPSSDPLASAHRLALKQGEHRVSTHAVGPSQSPALDFACARARARARVLFFCVAPGVSCAIVR